MLKLLNFFKIIILILLLNLQLIQSENLRYLTKPSSKQIINQEQQQSNLITNNENFLHDTLIHAGIPVDLISSYLTAKELYNYAHINHATFNSPDVKDHYKKQIKEGYKLINKTINYVGTELSQSAKELKSVLETLPKIPTEYVTYAYNNGYREALSLLVKYNITFDV